MLEHNKKLFDKTIHEVKQVIAEIQEERKQYHIDIKELTTHHNIAVEKQMKELLNVVEELYELYCLLDK